jgi:argininosuccinate lyase
VIAKTEASGGAALDPEILAFSTSLPLDRALLREDLLGSAAHVTMLAHCGILGAADAAVIRDGLAALWDDHARGALTLPNEEDVHMAVEAELTRRIGVPAGLLHTARSRNDQVALDLRLHVREQAALIADAVASLLDLLVARAATETEALMPAYTHRQRAQPITFAYLLCAYGTMLSRDLDALGFVLNQVDASPLGVGAIAGTSLPVDREITRTLLGFGRLTLNGLDTVGDRDFALDYLYSAARCLMHLGRLSTDFIDFASAEFGFLRLAGEIACGSSMMPQKRNPDVFELVRGKSGRAVGNLMGLLATVKGLPGGYNRDLQEDRAALLETGPLWLGVLRALCVAIPKVALDRERCRAALDGDYTQATDFAEALVRKGVPFREAYLAVGALVRRCQEQKIPLAKVTLAFAQAVDGRIDSEVLTCADPIRCAAQKESQGGTGTQSVKRQIDTLRQRAAEGHARARGIPRAEALFGRVRAAPLTPQG